MAEVSNPYAAIDRLLAEHGIVIIHKGGAPVNAVNLFDVLVGQGQQLTVKVDDDFQEKLRALSDDSRS